MSITSSELIERLESLKTQAAVALNSAKDLDAVEQLSQEWLSKKGELTNIMKNLGALSSDEKPKVGQVANDVRLYLSTELDRIRSRLKNSALNEKLVAERVDVTLPGRPVPQCFEHPVRMVTAELVEILGRCGFVAEWGPEIEHEFFNFDALNIPRHHPARAMQDTFYIKGCESVVLRTQTSPVQIRSMLLGEPPIRMIAPGRVYRSDYDATHSPMFHQVEGLLVDKNIHMGHLKGILDVLVREFFGSALELRLRPSFFPFTEPSAEVDMQCCFCLGKGCRVCKQSGWVEIAGCGMVDPEVFKAVNIDMESYRGFAFGLGVERMTMLKYGVHDLRAFFESDHRFISQFARWRP